MGCMPSKQKTKVIVVGASGYVGKATVSALVSRHGSEVEVFAGVRDPSKFAAMEGVTVVKADMGDKAGLTDTLVEYDRVFIVSPGHEDRTTLATNALEASRDAGVEFILVLSVLTSGTDSIFGKQFEPVEAKTKEIGLPHAIVRLPLFIDNIHLSADSIKNQGTFYDPREPSKPFTPVAVSDIGKASADILASYPLKHNGKVYKLVAPACTLDSMAAAFTKTLGKDVTVTTAHYNKAKESMMGAGLPEWQVDGIIELFKYIDDGSEVTNEANTGDIEAITGEKAITFEDWVEQNAAGFK